MKAYPVFVSLAILTQLVMSASAAAPLVERAPFGSTTEGEPVELFTLKNSNGLVAKVMTYGAILYSMEVPDRKGHCTNVTANRETLADYQKRSAAFGATVGRYANRIGNAKFTLDGKEYEVTRNSGKHHIHGGARGFDKRVWKGEPVQSAEAAAVRLSYSSRDGEEGYPGTLEVTVVYALNNRNELKLEYTATTDKPTHVNLSNHAYWNLAGAYSGDVLNHVLTLNSDKYLLADEGLIPTGEFASVANTPLDFRNGYRVGARMNEIKEKQFNGGYDHCMVINQARPGELTFCARLKDPLSGRTMEVSTTEPGVQIFSANFGPGAFEGPKGYPYPRHLGFCLETQHFPDSPNKPHFPTTVLRPGQTFRSVTLHRFAVE